MASEGELQLATSQLPYLERRRGEGGEQRGGEERGREGERGEREGSGWCYAYTSQSFAASSSARGLVGQDSSG